MKFSHALLVYSLAAAPIFAAPTLSVFEENVAAGLRLISTALSEETWMTEEETFDLKRAKIGFFDLTETYHLEKELSAKKTKAVIPLATYPAISHQTQVNALIATISTANMQTNLAALTAFNNRYYKSSTGLDGSNWIYNQLVSIAGTTPGVGVSKFKHSWVQDSIIARINGTSSGPVVIFAAHEDSINIANPTSGRAPGADDDGTGTVNLIEAFRVLLASGVKFQYPIEFHFNSGEEAGLLGSQAIAAAYKKAGTAVRSYVMTDMTGYTKPGAAEVIALVDDNVDAGLTNYLKSIIQTYCRIPASTYHCGYACSDHASWYKQGYPTALPFEGTYEAPTAHGTGDVVTQTGFSWTHSLEFVKLIVAVAYELGV